MLRIRTFAVTPLLCVLTAAGCKSDSTLPAGRPTFAGNRVVCTDLDLEVDGGRCTFGSVTTQGVMVFVDAEGHKFQTKLGEGHGLAYSQLPPGTYQPQVVFTRNYVAMHRTGEFHLPFRFTVPANTDGVYVGTFVVTGQSNGFTYQMDDAKVTSDPQTLDAFKKAFPAIATKIVSATATPAK